MTVTATKHPIAALALASLVGALLAASCGNDAVGVDACRRIEDARCRRAPGCDIALEPPFHTAGSDVDGCIRFYDTACLHGLAVGNPGGSAVNDCASAIESTTDCTSIRAPQNLAACAWLGPSSVPVDAAAAPADAAATDATAVDATAPVDASNVTVPDATAE